MLSPTTVLLASFGYLGLLFGVAAWADRRGAAGRSVIGNAWVYALSMGVFCTAWTYFGSIGRAATGGVWFLPIYLGPTLAMVLLAVLLPRMIRIARTHRITSIADFIASRHGKSPAVAAAVTVIAVVGLVPYLALQLKAVSVAYATLTQAPGSLSAMAPAAPWWADTTFFIACGLAGFTIVFGTRHLDASERHEGLVAAVALESVVKLVAFMAVGVFVTWGLFDGPSALFAQAQAVPALERLWQLPAGTPAAAGGAPGSAPAAWFALMLLAMLSVLMLPRQFQVMVVEAVDERHVRRAAWVFPLYLLLINLFVLPVAVGGLLLSGGATTGAETFVLSLPLRSGHTALALLAFIGGLSAATGMVIVETIAASTMVCNDLVLPGLLRSRRVARWIGGRGHDISALLLGIRRLAIVGVLMLGYAYFRLAGEAYALVSIGLISFAAVAQLAPALLGGLLWRGGTRDGAMAALVVGACTWAYTLMLPSIAKSGWLDAGFLEHGPFGWTLLRPEQLFGLSGLDPLTHALFWSLLLNGAAYVGVSLVRGPNAREAAQALLFLQASTEVSEAAAPVFWRGSVRPAELLALLRRFIGPAPANRFWREQSLQRGLTDAGRLQPDAALVQAVETRLAGVIGTASARVVVAQVAREDPLGMADVMGILEATSREARQLRDHSQQLEAQRRSLQQAGDALRAANEQLQGLDRLKDDFMSSVTHELRTPLTAIRALAELMRDDPQMPADQRQPFLEIVVAEAERLSRLVNQVLDLAKIESGQGHWQDADIDLKALLERAAQATGELFREKQATLTLDLHTPSRPIRGDADRLMQVAINLLSNAVKFVPRPDGQVRVALREGPTGLRVSVRDNGPGVPAAQRAVIFEKFRQGGDAANRPAGTGLGLPISRQIVEHHGGRLWLQSDPGQATAAAPGQDPQGAAVVAAPGAEFCFELPWAGAALTRAPTPPPAASAPPGELP